MSKPKTTPAAAPLPAAPASGPDTVELELIKPHIHRGLQLQPGSRLTVKRSKAAWFVNTVKIAREV